jgi:hypothetical protein
VLSYEGSAKSRECTNNHCNGCFDAREKNKTATVRDSEINQAKHVGTHTLRSVLSRYIKAIPRQFSIITLAPKAKTSTRAILRELFVILLRSRKGNKNARFI